MIENTFSPLFPMGKSALMTSVPNYASRTRYAHKSRPPCTFQYQHPFSTANTYLLVEAGIQSTDVHMQVLEKLCGSRGLLGMQEGSRYSSGLRGTPSVNSEELLMKTTPLTFNCLAREPDRKLERWFPECGSEGPEVDGASPKIDFDHVQHLTK